MKKQKRGIGKEAYEFNIPLSQKLSSQFHKKILVAQKVGHSIEGVEGIEQT